MTERREKMMAGEDAYLLPRDKGPVRRYVRDIVDARRNVLGLFMPAALGLIFVMLAVPSLAVQRLLSPAMLVLVLIMVVDGILVGRKVNRLVDEKFPDNTESGWKLGFYAASRASQLRRMRAPRPQVNRGDKSPDSGAGTGARRYPVGQVAVGRDGDRRSAPGRRAVPGHRAAPTTTPTGRRASPHTGRAGHRTGRRSKPSTCQHNCAPTPRPRRSSTISAAG